MKKNIRPTFFALPLGISDLKFKNNNSTIIMLGRLYCLWYKRKQNIRIRKKVLKEKLFWFSELSIKRALQELEAQNIIIIDHNVYKEERVYEINFTDFFKNKISNYSEVKSEAVEYDNEETEEINNEDIEEQEIDYSSTEQEEDYQYLEMLEEASNFDYSKLNPSDFLPDNFITAKGILCDRTYINDDDTEFELYPLFSNDDGSPMTIKQLIELKKKGDLDLETWKDFKKYFLPEWENLKSKGLV